MSRKQTRRRLVALAVYLILCTTGGIFLADATLHPASRPLTAEDTTEMREIANRLKSTLEEVTLTTPDNAKLQAWLLRPNESNNNAAILFHGLGDNRYGMSGYAQILLAHNYTVLMPDARAHGASGGDLATYGFLERNDIHQWFDWLNSTTHPRCIYGFGESMGAAQLLQSLEATHFCAVAAESPFSTFREIAYDRMGQPFHLGPWFGRTILRPLVEVALLRAQWKYHINTRLISPEDSVSESSVPVFLIHGQIDSNIPVRHSRAIHARSPRTILWEVPNADHCGAISTAPQEFENKLLDWFEKNHT